MDGLEVDVAVVGGGPAGAALAAALAPAHRVVLVDRPSHRRARAGLGETLPGAAARLLRELGVWDAFVAQGHPAGGAARSCWPRTPCGTSTAPAGASTARRSTACSGRRPRAAEPGC